MSHPLPRFEVELRDAAGATVYLGLAVSMQGALEPPPAIRFDGGVYLGTGEVAGTGSSPIRHVYRWAPHGQIDMTAAPPDPDPGTPAH